MHTSRLRRPAAIVAVCLAALFGCSSAPQLDAQWVDPALGAKSLFLQGEKILVACDAYDSAVRQICQDRLVGEVLAIGASPMTIPAGTVLANDRELDAQLVPSAAAMGAKAILVMMMTPASTDAGSGLSLGIGGFGIGRNSAAGIGLSVPIGAGRVNTGFAANGRVTDVRTGRMVWTASLVAAPSADLPTQFAELSRAMLRSAQRAGLF